jgi:hypothetical protein
MLAIPVLIQLLYHWDIGLLSSVISMLGKLAEHGEW